MGKSTVNEPFSIAVLNYQRVGFVDISTISHVPSTMKNGSSQQQGEEELLHRFTHARL
jgi:hypothetical protein